MGQRCGTVVLGFNYDLIVRAATRSAAVSFNIKYSRGYFQFIYRGAKLSQVYVDVRFDLTKEVVGGSIGART